MAQIRHWSEATQPGSPQGKAEISLRVQTRHLPTEALARRADLHLCPALQTARLMALKL